MPRDWSFDPWALSPWADEPARNAGHAMGRLAADLGTPGLSDTMGPSEVAADPDDYGPGRWFDHFASVWPHVDPVYPLDLQVLERDRNTVLTWMNENLSPAQKRSYVVCFHMAKYQMDLAALDVSGPPALDPESHLVLREDRGVGGGRTPEVQLKEMRLGLGYIIASLEQDDPVMIGIKLSYYTDEPNDLYGTPYVVPTDHFVVVVGCGLENGTPYIQFFDYLNRFNQHRDRMYLTRQMTMRTSNGVMQLTEVRKSYPASVGN